jgi:hypothetical protein
MTLAFVENIECAIHGDPVYPGAKVGSSIEALELAIASEEGFLHDLFRVGLIFGNAEGDTKDTLAVACYKQAVSVFVSG